MREGVTRAAQTLGVSQRRACAAAGQPRSTQRYTATKPLADRPLVAAMLALARKHPRYGYRRIHAMLRLDGFRVGRDRVHRLWRLHHLRVPRRTIKRRRLGTAENGVVRRQSERVDHVWTYDFVSDQTADGRRLKILTVEDEFTRECLALEVARSIPSRGVIGVLRELFAVRGTQFIAAERLGRRCFGFELSPRYCDLIVRRFIAYAGGDAVPREIAERYAARPAASKGGR